MKPNIQITFCVAICKLSPPHSAHAVAVSLSCHGYEYVTSKHWILNWMYFRLLRSIMTLPLCNMARDSVLHWIVPYLCRHDKNCVLNVIHNYQDYYKLHLNKTLSDTTRDKPHNNCQYNQWLWTGQPGYEALKGQDLLFVTTSRPEQPPNQHTQKAFSPLFYFVPSYSIVPLSSAANQETELVLYMVKQRKFLNKYVKVILKLFSKWQFYQLRY